VACTALEKSYLFKIGLRSVFPVAQRDAVIESAGGGPRGLAVLDLAPEAHRLGFGRRITREIDHSGDATITFHDYWSSGWQLLETRDGSGHVLKQHVWGLEYIDELIQIAVNRDVYIDTTEDQCERVYFVLQDAHYNVIGLASGGGHLVERYEYTPYGQRKVFSQPQPLGDFDGDGKLSRRCGSL